jgi:hypothetical protein
MDPEVALWVEKDDLESLAMPYPLVGLRARGRRKEEGMMNMGRIKTVFF